MSEPSADVALLTPVHRQHLKSGLDVCAKAGLVAFGTDAGLVLSELLHLIDDDHPADVLFYASHPPDPGAPKATFRGRFVDYDGAIAGKVKEAWAKYRPNSTGFDAAWTGFYLVKDLQILEFPITISALNKRGNGGKLARTFRPHGPLIIETPF